MSLLSYLFLTNIRPNYSDEYYYEREFVTTLLLGAVNMFSLVLGDVDDKVHHLLDGDDLVPVCVGEPHHFPG